MQWILQPFEDTERLAEALDRLERPYTWHKVVPFVGDLMPEPEVPDPNRMILFGAYVLWRQAERHGWKPGVFRIRPFLEEASWAPFLLNGPGALVLPLRDVPGRVDPGRDWFLRPVDDSKAEPGRVRSGAEIVALAQKVCALDPEEIPRGSLRPDTDVMICPPVTIQKEWRLWVVADRVVTWSLYKEGRRITYRNQIDDDVRAFAEQVIAANPGYADAYVLDICRTADGLFLLETNCINAAGFYAADLMKLVMAIEALVA